MDRKHEAMRSHRESCEWQSWVGISPVTHHVMRLCGWEHLGRRRSSGRGGGSWLHSHRVRTLCYTSCHTSPGVHIKSYIALHITCTSCAHRVTHRVTHHQVCTSCHTSCYTSLVASVHVVLHFMLQITCTRCAHRVTHCVTNHLHQVDMLCYTLCYTLLAPGVHVMLYIVLHTTCTGCACCVTHHASAIKGDNDLLSTPTAHLEGLSSGDQSGTSSRCAQGALAMGKGDGRMELQNKTGSRRVGAMCKVPVSTTLAWLCRYQP